MTDHPLGKLVYVNIIGGPYTGEKGRIWEVFSGEQYGVKLLTGPDANQKGTFIARRDQLEVESEQSRRLAMTDAASVEQSLIERLFIRAKIRRAIPTRKSVAEGKEDRLAALLDEAGEALVECLAALKPFAECAEQINPEEEDEEWAKFRLLIKNYRQAAMTFKRLMPIIPDAERLPVEPG